ncbi:MAG TPA: hypothetical protein VIU12_23090 [Chryseolinea sp.]
MARTAYVDYNVLLSLMDGRKTIEDIYTFTNQRDITFFYSASHVQEADNIPASHPNRNSFIKQRLNYINKLTCGNYLYSDTSNPNVVVRLNANAFDLLETITEVPFGKDMMRRLTNLIGEPQRQAVRDSLGISTKELNNYTIPQILQHLEKLAGMTNMTFAQFMEHTKSFHKDRDSFGFHNDVAGVFEILDIIGYWKDSYTENSNFARLWDASHTAFAASCDYFLTNDQKTYNKVQVVYHIYDIKTKTFLFRS